LLANISAASNEIVAALCGLGEVTRGQGMWAIREMVRVAEVGMEVACTAEIIAARMEQRARQVMIQR
jgi:hypothetical protein